MNNLIVTSWSSPASYEPSYPAYEQGRGFYILNVNVSDWNIGA